MDPEEWGEFGSKPKICHFPTERNKNMSMETGMAMASWKLV